MMLYPILELVAMMGNMSDLIPALSDHLSPTGWSSGEVW